MSLPTILRKFAPTNVGLEIDAFGSTADRRYSSFGASVDNRCYIINGDDEMCVYVNLLRYLAKFTAKLGCSDRQ